MIIYTKKGVTRTSIIISNKYVIKIPSIGHSWFSPFFETFIRGMLCNIQETKWWAWTKDDRLCPIIFCIPFGLLLVMKYARPIECDEFPTKEYFNGLPLDYKQQNFGVIDNDNKGWRIVLVDYGS